MQRPEIESCLELCDEKPDSFIEAKIVADIARYALEQEQKAERLEILCNLIENNDCPPDEIVERCPVHGDCFLCRKQYALQQAQQESKAVNKPELCSCGKPGKMQYDNGLPCGIHCDECFMKMVAECRSKSW